MTFDKWMDKVHKLGIKEGFFDRPGTRFLCAKDSPRIPARGTDSIWWELFNSGMSPRIALGEAFVEQDGE